MDASIDAGCCSTGILPGGLKVKRRAPQIAADIRNRHEANLTDPAAMMDWINLWAMAVNEENAAGSKVVTAPTNGAAGIIPAVIRFYRRGYRGRADLPARRGCGRCALQAQRQHIGCRGRLSGRGRRRLLDGGCDPIGGLVQIPCIERNAMGAIKAIDASRIAMIGDGTHVVTLDTVIATMLQTGRDMRDKYKETSKGGLAVSVVEC